MKTVAAFALTSIFCLAPSAYAQQSRELKEQGEGDLNATQRETDPGKRIKLLDDWARRYPESDYKTDRLTMTIQTYQQMGKLDEMYAAAKELKGIAPTNPAALYY